MADQSAGRVSLHPCFPKGLWTASTAPERMFVAIHKFENKTDASASDIDTLQARVQQCVVGTRKFEVVEREQLKTVMKEANLAAAGITDGETGKILAQKSAIGIGLDKAMAAEGFSSSKSGGLRDAVDEAAHLIVDALRDHSYPAKIVAVGKKSITVNMTDEEVKEEDVFDVVECGEMLFDPDTGAPLDDDGDDVGRVQISKVGPKVSKAVPLDDLDLDDLDLDEHSYKLRRVSKATLKKEAKKASQKKKAAFESRF